MKRHKEVEATTLNGSVVTNVAVDRNGLPLLNNKMGFLTVSKSGRVIDRSKTKEDMISTSK